MKLLALGSFAAALSFGPAPSQCAPATVPAPSSPTNCRVVSTPEAPIARGVRCDAGPFNGTTQFRAVMKYKTCGLQHCADVWTVGEWLVPPDMSSVVVDLVAHPLGTPWAVGWQTR